MNGTRTRTRLTSQRGRPRGPGTLYAAVSVVLLVIVSGLALTSRQTPPPTIAEFAPQAVEQITDSSADCASGGRPDDVAAGDVDPSAAADGAAVSSVDVARVRQCVGDPPRQIEDPQSPPCVAY